MTYQPHQSEDVTMKPVAGMNIDEAALKAGMSDEEIVAFAKDFYERTEHGVKLNVPAFARALLNRSQGQEPVARNNALRDDHPLSKGFCAHDVSMAKHCAACAKPPSRDTVVPAEQAEDSAMRKDAMRYRWLRAGNYPISFARSVLNDTPHGIDAAIDAARNTQ